MVGTEETSCSSKIMLQKDDSKEPKNLFSHLVSKIELKIPFFVNEAAKIKAPDSNNTANREGPRTPQPPQSVVFSNPNQPPIIQPPIEVDVKESSGRTHNPLVIWQVYAVGGFIILNWIWARWKERKEGAKKASSDEYQSPDDEYQSLADDEE